MRAYWTGTLGFGLINIPIKVLTATKEEGLGFEMVHATDLAPIHYKKVCEQGHEVTNEDVIKAYRTEGGQLVTLSKDDFRKASVRKTSTMDIISFVEGSAIPLIYYEKPYYLEVEAGGEEAFDLLRQAMLEAGEVALVRYVFRNRENVGMLMPIDTGILLMQLRFQFQIQPQPGKRREHKVEKRELTMALALIKKLHRGFKPKEYRDTYREDLEQLIAARATGQEPSMDEAEAPIPTNVIDLMAMLKKSLSARASAAPKKSGHWSAKAAATGDQGQRQLAAPKAASVKRKKAKAGTAGKPKPKAKAPNKAPR